MELLVWKDPTQIDYYGTGLVYVYVRHRQVEGERWVFCVLEIKSSQHCASIKNQTSPNYFSPHDAASASTILSVAHIINA